MNSIKNELLLVDGYNIINAWDILKDAQKISLETAREKLIEIMADYSAQMGIRVVIVFDAHQVKNIRRTSYNIYGVEVIFTKEGETADHYIEKVVEAIGRVEKVRVATSDWVEQQIVLARGAARISARELYNEVKEMIYKRRKKEKCDLDKKKTLWDRLDPEVKNRLIKQIKGHNNKMSNN